MNIAETLRLALISAALALPLATPAAAQEQSAEETAFEPGEPYLAATHRDWEVLCTRFEVDEPEVCEMYQLLIDGEQNPIAEISIAALPPGNNAAEGLVAGATITTPLETFLPTGLGWRVGDVETMRVEGFRTCTVVGCFARIGFNTEEVEVMKRGSHAIVTIAPFVAIDQPIDIRVSLLGFTAALEDLQARLPAPDAAPQD
ncbi:MAG: invasion associated locus B family protein [Pararhodobacter sp.]